MYGICRACGHEHTLPDVPCTNCGCPRDACPVCYGDHYSDKTAYCEDCQSEIHICPDCEYAWTDISRGDTCPVCGWHVTRLSDWFQSWWWRVRATIRWIREGYPKAPF